MMFFINDSRPSYPAPPGTMASTPAPGMKSLISVLTEPSPCGLLSKPIALSYILGLLFGPSVAYLLSIVSFRRSNISCA